MQKLESEHSQELDKVRLESQQVKDQFNKEGQQLKQGTDAEKPSEVSLELVNANLEIAHLQKKLKECKDEHEKEIEMAKINVRKNLETVYVAKFEAVSKQIQATHKTELDNLRRKMEQENGTSVITSLDNLKSVVESGLSSGSRHLPVKKVIDITQDVKEPIGITVLQNNKIKSNDTKSFVEQPQISPGDYEALEKHLDILEEERNNLKQMQCLMKDLITDLALHYNLSENQMRFLSESQQLLGLADFFINESRLSEIASYRLTDLTAESPNPLLQYLTNKNNSMELGRGDPEESIKQSERFDSSQCPLQDSRFTPGRSTPNTSVSRGHLNQSIISLEELSNLLNEGSFKSDSSSAEQIMKELREQVII